MDHLSQITDETLENRQKHIPAAELIIDEIRDEFISWTRDRKFAPTIHALKAKLNSIKEGELTFQRKKYPISMKNKPKSSAIASFKKSPINSQII